MLSEFRGRGEFRGRFKQAPIFGPIEGPKCNPCCSFPDPRIRDNGPVQAIPGEAPSSRGTFADN